MKVQNVSSRWTFLLKLAFPLLWIIIMGGISIVILFSPLEGIKEPFTPFSAKIMTGTFYFSVIALLYLLFGKSKWVGMTETHLYVSDYFKSFKYTYDSIESFEEINMVLFTKVVVNFHQPTKFGKSIFFIKSHYWKYFLEKHPHILETISGAAPQKVITEEEK